MKKVRFHMPLYCIGVSIISMFVIFLTDRNAYALSGYNSILSTENMIFLFVMGTITSISVFYVFQLLYVIGIIKKPGQIFNYLFRLLLSVLITVIGSSYLSAYLSYAIGGV